MGERRFLLPGNTRASGGEMRVLQAVILHRHALFRDLIAFALREIGPLEVVDTTNDPTEALAMVLRHRANALLVETAEGFIGRREMLQLFCDAADAIPQFVVIAADLQSSTIEVVYDGIGERSHLRGLEPLLHGVGT
jgi:DNA-binding NarL/FixJ family response regulator